MTTETPPNSLSDYSSSMPDDENNDCSNWRKETPIEMSSTESLPYCMTKKTLPDSLSDCSSMPDDGNIDCSNRRKETPIELSGTEAARNEEKQITVNLN